jgi:hypothetical protein
MTRHPSFLRAFWFLRSRSTFDCLFAVQNSDRVAGLTLPKRHRWQCQKQP